MENMVLDRKDAIISTAIDIIDEYGIQGLSTREVAKRQGVSEGTVFKHFKTKNGLILAVLDQFSMFDNEIILTIKMKNLKPVDAIYFFANAYAEYYENYSAITAITEGYDALAYDPELSVKIKGIFAGRLLYIKSLIEEAQHYGEIQPEADSDDLAAVVSGIFRSVCIQWRFSNRNFPFKEHTMRTLKMVLDAFGTK
jgi:AcrR family transcriptional regulator